MRVFIGLGSSIGDARTIFASVEKFLKKHQISVLQKSKILKNPPLGGVAQNEFSNAVWEIDVSQFAERENPEAFLTLLQTCERTHGRIREKKWADRTLDLDILMYGPIIMQNSSLILPHPEIPNRIFVLHPWQEIVDENFKIPQHGEITALLQKLKNKA